MGAILIAFLAGIAAAFVLSFLVVMVLVHRAPEGREIPGVGFVREK